MNAPVNPSSDSSSTSASPPRRSILGQAGPLLLARGGATILGFILPLLLTRMLSQPDFGTYKQLWLVVMSGYFMLQFGLSQSLYYFVPRRDGRGRAWYTQALLGTGLFGAVGSLGVYAARGLIAQQFGNPDLARFGLPMALICWTLVATSALEVELTAVGDVRGAGWIIFLSDALRVVSSVVPLLMGLGLAGLFWSYVVHGGLRFLVCLWLLWRRGGPEFDRKLMREQLLYAVPFGAAILLDTPQKTFHQWAVGWSVAPAMFAIYSQGCFQLPIVNLLYSPISDVLQVRMAEPGGRAHGVDLFHEANLRLASVFFPFTALLCAAGALFIPALFTHRYDASIPIFRVAILATPFAALPLDGMLRALGKTRYLFRIFFWKLLVTMPAVLVGLRSGGMVGAILGHSVAEAAIRIAMLNEVRTELGCGWSQILPWQQLERIAGLSLISAIPVIFISRFTSSGARPFAWLFVAGIAYGVVYLVGLALGPGEGGPVEKIRRTLLGGPSLSVGPALARPA